MNDKIEPFYQMQAKQFIDGMYDAKVFSEKMTRDDMKGFEDLLAYLFQTQAKSTKKAIEFLSSLKHLK
jgi:hypothetical protein